jgi:polyketide biosynthesis 3-hydroxy-3-methylglutaryl-CoA synthase-like enzyme PksG
MGGTIFLSLASTIDHGDFEAPKRIGCFSYGSGCCSEFYSGIVSKAGKMQQQRFNIARGLNDRYHLSMEEYEGIIRDSHIVRFGTRSVRLDQQLSRKSFIGKNGKETLTLKEIKEYHRQYEWIS